jgi:hypothetical protein
MPTKNHISSSEIEELETHAGGKRSEPEGRAEVCLARTLRSEV